MNKNKIFSRGMDEPLQSFLLRKAFVEASPAKSTMKTKQLIIMYSWVLSNMIFLKCRYGVDAEEFIKTYLTQNKKKILENLVSQTD